MKLKLLHRCLVGGLTDLGVSQDGRHVLAVSHNGRGVFDLATGGRVARDYTPPTESWYRPDDAEADGIGPCQGEVIGIFGFSRETPGETMREIQQLDPHSQLTEFRAAQISHDGSKLVVGFSDEIAIYERRTAP